jgi:hypothetical protein
MTYNLKKDGLKNWNLQQANEKPMINIENDDDQDIYISERSSVASSNDINQTHNTTGKRLPTPPTPILSVPIKQAPTLRLSHNELHENGIPIVNQNQLQRKEEKKKKKDLRRGRPGQGALVPIPEIKPPELVDSYYSHWYYSKAKNSDWITRQRQAADGQIIPNESLDPSQNAHQPALTTSTIKPRQQPRKTRYNHVPTIQSNQDKQRLDNPENNSTASTHSISHENHENNYQKQKPSPRQNIPLKDSDHDEHRIQPTKRTISRQRRKLKPENEWTNNHVQSVSSNKSSQDSSTLIITSNSLTNQPKNRSKLSDIDENGKHRHQQPHHYPYHQNQTQSYNPPSIPSHQNHYHHQAQQHLHIRRRPPSGTYLGSEFQLLDISFKKSDRPSYIQQAREPFHSPISPVYNQTPYLPPIIRDHYQHKTYTPRFPMEYYGTLARQTHGSDWEEPMDIPKIYKPDTQTRFYDRYLHSIVDKRLAA